MEISYGTTAQHVLEEEYDEDYDPTEEEVLEYCKVIGLDPVAEKDLLHIAKEGIKAPLPKDWKPIEDALGNIYYFNFTSGESMWDHPCDHFYRGLLQRERKKKLERGRGGERKGKTGEGMGRKSTGAAKKGLVTTAQGKPTLPPSLGVPPLPRSSGGLGGVGLPSLGGLPPLKGPARAGALAPLRIPTAMATSQSGSGLGGSLTSTGASTLRSPALTGGSRGHALGTIELGTAAISTHFEEEDEEEEDSDSDLVGGFKSKLGLNVMGAEDLGFMEEEEEEESGGDSSEDVSQELRRVLELDQSGGGEEESEEREGVGMDTPDRPDNPAVPEPVLSGVRDLHGVGVAVDKVPGQPSHLGRPRAARGSRPPPLLSAVHPGAVGGVASTPPEGVASHPALTIAAITGAPGGRNPEVVREDDGRLHSAHAEDLEQLRQRLAEELEAAQRSLREEHEVTVASLRRELASELVEEEKRMRAERETTLEALRVKLCEEEEEEEARLHESKEDRLRRLRQQLLQEQEKEERKLRESKEKALQDLRSQLRDKQSEEESQLRSSAEGELGELRRRLAAELEEERGGARAAHEKELGALQQQLREEHQQASQELRSAIEQELNLEEERRKAEEAQRLAQQALQTELAAALDARQRELQEQHRSQLDALEQQLARELETLREEEGRKVEEERVRLEEELEETKTALEKEHEAKLEELREECAASQRQHEERRQEQVRELAALETQHEQRKAELGELQDGLEQQRLEVEGEQRRLTEEEEELRAQEERLQALRSAGAQEEEQLLQRQQGEQAAVEAERKNLKSLKRSRSSLEEELRSLQGQVEQERRQLAQLQSQKGALKASRSATKRKTALKNAAVQTSVNPDLPTAAPAVVVEDPQTTLQSSAGLPLSPSPLSPSPPRAAAERPPVTWIVDQPPLGGERVINVNPSKRERVKFEGSPDPGEESDQSLTSTSSMRLDELTTHPHKKKLTTPPFPEAEEGVSELEGTRHRQERMGPEQTSPSRARSELRQQQRVLSERAALRQADRQTHRHQPRNRRASENSEQGLMRDVQSRLEQEGTALTELEQRMKSSRQQLSLREQQMRELQASLHSDGRSSDQDSEPPPDPPDLSLGDLPSPQTYLARLRERLEESRRTTSRRPRGSLATTAAKPLKLQLSDGSTASSSGSAGESSETTETEDVLRQKPASGPSKPRFSAATRKLLKGRGGMAGGSQGEIMSSLSKINGQLGELLTKLNQPPPAYPETSLHAGHLQDQDVAPSVLAGTQRWADPVRDPDKTDLALQRRRTAYLGLGVYCPITAPEPLAASATPLSPFPCTRQGLRNQTDWLKEFQRSVPLSSRLGGAALAHGTPSTGTRAFKHRPKLTLDGSNNIQLVQV